jgi:hypothetical protein
MTVLLPHIFVGVAGAGCLIAALAHSILGERLFVPQIQSQMNWPGGKGAGDFKRQIVRLAWHATSVMWAGFSALLFAQLWGYGDPRSFYLISAAIFAIVLIMTGPVTSWRHVGWPIFAAITACLIAAAIAAV